ncbi:MAG: VCBS repeat-containing protein, partial [Phycisphaerae bacterium]|nr:VCBS repeat-containing protein [Phycisphaerae bacterium]
MGFRSTTAIAVAALAIAEVALGQLVPFTNEAVARGLVYPMGSLPAGGVTSGQSVGFADLDGDMDMDVICLGRENNQVGVFENTGAGVFINRSATSGIPAFANPSSFAAGDYDADGDLDLVITTWGSGI